jgi:hypothetical protein
MLSTHGFRELMWRAELFGKPPMRLCGFIWQKQVAQPSTLLSE